MTTTDNTGTAGGVVAVLRSLEWGFQNRRCLVCAGFNVGANGETDHAHTRECPVPQAIRTVEAVAEALKGMQRKLAEVASRHNDRTCDFDVCKEVRDTHAAIAAYHGQSALGPASPAEKVGAATGGGKVTAEMIEQLREDAVAVSHYGDERMGGEFPDPEVFSGRLFTLWEALAATPAGGGDGLAEQVRDFLQRAKVPGKDYLYCLKPREIDAMLASSPARVGQEDGVDLCEVARELERVHIAHVLAEVAALACDRTDAYWSGHSLACEEIAHRLELPAAPAQEAGR